MITCQLFFFTCTMMKLKLKKNKLFNYSAGWIQNLTLEFGRERGVMGRSVSLLYKDIFINNVSRCFKNGTF